MVGRPAAPHRAAPRRNGGRAPANQRVGNSPRAAALNRRGCIPAGRSGPPVAAVLGAKARLRPAARGIANRIVWVLVLPVAMWQGSTGSPRLAPRGRHSDVQSDFHAHSALGIDSVRRGRTADWQRIMPNNLPHESTTAVWSPSAG